VKPPRRSSSAAAEHASEAATVELDGLERYADAGVRAFLAACGRR